MGKGAATKTEQRVRVVTYISPAASDKLSKVADANDRSLAAEIRRAITAHLEQAE